MKFTNQTLKNCVVAGAIFLNGGFAMVALAQPAPQPPAIMQWRDATTLLIEGRAFSKTATPYDRLAA